MGVQYFDHRNDTVVAKTAIVKNRFVSRDGSQGALQGNWLPAVSAIGTAPLGVARADARIGEAVAVIVEGTAVVETTAAIPFDGCPVLVQPDGRVTPSPGSNQGLVHAKQATAGPGLVEVDLNIRAG